LLHVLCSFYLGEKAEFLGVCLFGNFSTKLLSVGVYKRTRYAPLRKEMIVAPRRGSM
jgi:hypothetical protein